MPPEAISERSVLAKAPLAGTGVLVHRASATGFLTLHLVRASATGMGPPNVGAINGGWLRVNVAGLPPALWCPLTPGAVLQNFPIAAGQEVWVATDQIGQCVVTGFTSESPIL